MRHALAYETRTENDDEDPLLAATRAVEELRTNVETFRTATDERLAAELRTITTRLDAIDTRTQRPGPQQERTNEPTIEQRAFLGFVRRGRESLTADEVRTLRVADDTAGGYLAPAEFVAEVDKNVVQFSPVRQAARVGTTQSGSVIIPRRTGRPTANWVGETEDRTETESTYGQAEVPIDEIACYVDVSNRLLEDAAVNIAAEVSYDLGEEFGRLEGAAFVAGNGFKKPLGFMTDTNVLYTPGTDASLLKPDGLIDLFYALAPFYRQRAVWMLNGSSLAAIRKLKDTTGQYLWQASIAAGQPETILGRPAIEAVDMPDVAGNAYPVVFGDFASAYRIYDRIALALIRDPFTQATKGLTRFHARRRVGGRVVRPEAIRKLKIATS